MSVLFRSENISRSANFEVTKCNTNPWSELCKFSNCLQTLFRLLRKTFSFFIQEKGIGNPVGTSYTPANLIELGKSHPVRILDNQRIRVRNIETGFNNRSGNQNINFSRNKGKHDFLEFPLPHLPVSIGHPGIRHEPLHTHCRIRYAFYPIVHIVNLSVSSKLPLNRFPDGGFIFLHDIGLNRQTVKGRLFQDGKVTNSH